ncbi:MAG: putative phosphocarrier protein hpr (Phosphohistidinoprotein-hexose phosphotransferase) [uncultured bacterium]|nr:MAG: putative phosphocarrier protein hpr (Phosphohistidinoprotein-hexose phosphotransferase) [uncultured bacterium]
MLDEKITIINKLGLHTRAAAKLVALAGKFESKIEIQKNEQVANCKSIMSIIVLGVTKGTILNLMISGPDELEACDAIVQLINNRFGEAE